MSALLFLLNRLESLVNKIGRVRGPTFANDFARNRNDLQPKSKLADLRPLNCIPVPENSC